MKKKTVAFLLAEAVTVSAISAWADNGNVYGLSEFLIRQGAEVEVADTWTTEEFLAQIQ